MDLSDLLLQIPQPSRLFGRLKTDLRHVYREQFFDDGSDLLDSLSATSKRLPRQ
jgi:hypothetical protein